MKLQRSDFPPHVPAHVVDRVLAVDAERYNWRPRDVLALIALGGMGLGVFIAAKILGWGYWVPAVITAPLLGLTPVLRVFEGRKVHKAFVDSGLMCPKCHRAMLTDTWSMKDQETQRNAMMSGYCPRCLERIDRHVEPNVK